MDAARRRAVVLRGRPIFAALPETASDLQRQEAERLAELRAIAGKMRARALAGRRVDLDRLIKIEGLCSRLARTLAIDKPKPKPPLLPWQLLSQRKAA